MNTNLNESLFLQTAYDVVAHPKAAHKPSQRLYAWCVLMGKRGKRVDQNRIRKIQRQGQIGMLRVVA